MAIPTIAIPIGAKFIGGVIGGRGAYRGGEEISEETRSRWMAGWKREMTATQWAYFSQWIASHQKKDDWETACNCLTPEQLTWAMGRLTWPWPNIQRKSNDILGKSPNCRLDWRQTGGLDVQELVDDQANANLPPERRVSVAGLGGSVPLLIAGAVLLALMFSKTR